MRRTMKNALTAVPFTIILLILSVPGHSQSVQDPLRLVQTISIPGVEGRFDHLAVDLKGKRLFLAAQAHRSVEVFDLAAGKRIHSIEGIGAPHAERYVPASNELLVSVGDEAEGALKILKGDTFETLATFKILVDADGITYDPVTQYVYIENGGKDAGNTEYCLVSVIDTANRKNIGDIRVDGAELEAMAVEHSGTRLFVNVKTLKQVGIIDRNKRQVISTWPIPGAGVNAERRRTERFNFWMPLTVQWTSGSEQRKAHAVTRDVSSGGMYFFLPEAIPDGTAIEVAMTLPTQI